MEFKAEAQDRYLNGGAAELSVHAKTAFRELKRFKNTLQSSASPTETPVYFGNRHLSGQCNEFGESEEDRDEKIWRELNLKIEHCSIIA